MWWLYFVSFWFFLVVCNLDWVCFNFFWVMLILFCRLVNFLWWFVFIWKYFVWKNLYFVFLFFNVVLIWCNFFVLWVNIFGGKFFKLLIVFSLCCCNLKVWWVVFILVRECFILVLVEMKGLVSIVVVRFCWVWVSLIFVN